MDVEAVRVRAAPCPVCGPEKSRVTADPTGYEMMVYCTNCYDADCVGDPAHYVSSSIMAFGRNLNEAIADWNEKVEDMTEPTHPREGREVKRGDFDEQYLLTLALRDHLLASFQRLVGTVLTPEALSERANNATAGIRGLGILLKRESAATEPVDFDDRRIT